MAYFNTESVHVFPSSYRKEISDGKYNSEHNFVNILNSLVDKENYVLSYETTDDGDLLRVVLHGYYFEIKNFKEQVSDPCYISILVENKVHSSLVNYSQKSVDNLDDPQSGEFRGLDFETGTVTDEKVVDGVYTYYYLQVTDRDGNILNKVRLSTDSIFYSGNERTLTNELDDKQSIVKAGNGIKGQGLDNVLPDSKVELIDSYNSILNSIANGHSGNVGSNSKFIYVADNSVNASTLNAGSGYNANNTGYKYTKDVHVTDGNIVDGTTFFISEDTPDRYPSSIAKNGDFWFKYQP